MENKCIICGNDFNYHKIVKISPIPFLSNNLYAFCSEECYKKATDINSILLAVCTANQKHYSNKQLLFDQTLTNYNNRKNSLVD